ncbi:nitrate- and nitrite sensing domain-containing protein [Streptomyces sp. WI04-05B]|uniref:sensor histidine kinase n=1 Tax=Streptomyces TaxID=1883 RepID=UPI0029B37FE0|nr:MULTISPECIES: nitrate- and nitrite sensing domain-containing protein [unclassified Streptomyces]MDX2549005.1 nitrate- and nitrite sensing domain-containing protein [Streptomyces sp. WI04-05B]MDX2590605.1 nitrate- and nitrite sensing domain-containing protein [Streptomyces sp. WI04-05A]MDX3746203.1 nitrate- and nitrite sensing domain-containing protein [Streptomyces sp. AK08-02]
MRFRGKSIRRKIVALLLVPLVSLTAIWGFATVLTGREAAELFNVSSIVEKVSYPTEDAVRVLQQERRQTLVYLADPRASDALAALRRSRTATDGVIDKIRANADKADVRNSISDSDGERLTAVLEAFDGIGPLRRSVEEGTVTRSQALDLYNRLVDPCYVLLANLHIIDNLEMDKQARALVNTARARELLSREDALLGSALVVGRLSRDESRDISDLVAQRTVMYDVSLPLLPLADRARYDRFWKNASTAPLRVAEQAAIGTESGHPRGVTAKSWDTTAGDVLDELRKLNDESGDRYQDRVRPVVTGVIVKAVVAGVLGLVALLFSLFLSVRIGRALIRDLRRLRLEAHEASGVRLPSVMRRLSAGEQVDVETEVPRLEYDKNEIGEVGQALNTLQRAAVEAAVKQAELRSGVSEVFVNLARRSQVLLHKQLTLLDTMERRTEDTDELADLFRLDHLTTRMRRHAEGLVILSGAAPSRQWRKPVQLMDVVRAAVAEVEDYERIEVRRLPRMAVTGPAVADLTHLVAELLENATVFSPPHTAIQVLGERVANGFTLEIHDRGLGMAAEALLDANLRLAETPEFELSDTDRLGLFVVSRLAQRQNVRVSLQPSPYGGTTAVVFVPDALLTDDVPDTNGIGFRLDRAQPSKEAEFEGSRRAALSPAPVRLPGLPPSLIDGPVELEAPVDLDSLDDFPGSFDDADSEQGVLPRTRRSVTGVPGDLSDSLELPRRRTPKLVSSHGRPVTEQSSRRNPSSDEQPVESTGSTDSDKLAPLPARRRGEAAIRRETDPREGFGDRAESPGRPWDGRGKPVEPLASRFGDRPVGDRPDLPARGTAGRAETARDRLGDPLPQAPALPQRDRRGGSPAAPDPTESGPAGLPRRVRQANLAPQLREGPERRTERMNPRTQDGADLLDRDADEVRSRMASLQRGWQRGREENAVGDGATDGTAQGTSKGDGR